MSLKFLKIIVGAVILAGFFYLTATMVDTDLWWHLKVGQWIDINNSVPHYDVYSHTMPNYDWVDHETLVELWFWKMESQNLWWLVEMAFALVIFTPFLLWIKRAKHPLTLWLILLPAAYFIGIAGVRPQWISFLLFFVVFEILQKRYGHNRKTKLFYILPLIFLTWSNLHAGFASGLSIFALLIVADNIIKYKKERRLNIRELAIDTGVIMLSIVATLINPYGTKIYQEIYSVVTSSNTLRYISEWKSPLRYLNLSLMLYLASFLSFILTYGSFKKYRLQFLSAGIVVTSMFLLSSRHGLMFFIITMPLLNEGYEIIKSKVIALRHDIPLNYYEQRFLKMIKIGLFALTIFSFVYGVFSYKPYYFPSEAADFIANEFSKKEAVVFNHYDWGSYLIWRAPKIKIFIDGRMPHWENQSDGSAMNDYLNTILSPSDGQWKEIFKRRHVDTVIIPSGNSILSSKKSYWPERMRQKLSDGLISFIERVTGRQEKGPGLKAILTANGWSIIYDDEIATILSCRVGRCY